jgi:uncharacterized protein YqjF (DUF2071 family)
MSSVFLTGEWKKLVMINFIIDPERLDRYLPAGTRINYFEGKCYLTLVAFTFNNIQFKRMLSLYPQVYEVNLRFYVIPEDGSQEDRGVVFIKEIVGQPLLALGANLIYREHYSVLSVHHHHLLYGKEQSIQYEWKTGQWNWIRMLVTQEANNIEEGSEAHFITQQPYGYTKASENKTLAYSVSHSAWKIFKLRSYSFNIQYGESFGEDFAFLQNENPASFQIADGSSVSIQARRKFELKTNGKY